MIPVSMIVTLIFARYLYNKERKAIDINVAESAEENGETE